MVVPAKAPASTPLASNQPAPRGNSTAPKLIVSTVASTGPRAGAPFLDSAALTKVGDVDWNEVLASEDLSTRNERGSDSGLRFRSVNEPDFIPIPSTFASITPLPAAESNKSIHSQAWQSSYLVKRRQILTLATIGITGSLFAIGAFFLFLRMVGSKSQPIAKEQVVAPQLPGLVKPESTIEKTPDSADGQIPTVDHGNNTGDTPSISQTPPTSETSEPAIPLQPAPETTPTSSSLPPLSPETKSSLDVNVTASVFDFPGIPSILGMANTSLDIATPNSDLPELNVENAAVYQAQVFHPLPKPIPNWDENSKLVQSAFRTKDKISLLRCIDLFGRMTGIGITVDWQSCRVAGIDLAKKVDINEKDKTIAELMTQLVQANGLEWTFNGNGLPVISASKAAMEAKLPVDWSTAGLFPEGAEREACDALLRLWGYDDVCRFSDGRLTWNEQATPIEKANLLASLFELAKLQRLDANHPWRKSTESPLVFSPSYWNHSFAGLERKISPNVIAPERRTIPDLLMTAADATKLNLVIDWQSVWSHGMTPKDSSVIVLSGRTFPQTAKRFLTEFALEIVPVLDDTVWLTTREVRQSLIRIVPVHMPKNYKIDDLRQSLRILAPVVDDQTRFRVVPIPGTEDLYFARICSPKADQLNDPELMLSLGWHDKP